MKINVSDYPHSFKRQVFLYETDAFGHTNNVTFFQYMESARFELMKELRLFDPSDILSCNFILAHAECDYRQISRYDDTLVIYSRISQIKTSSFVIENLMINEKTGNLVATGKAVLVSFNHKNSRTEPVSQKAKKALKSYMGAVKK
jgi:acyl-CoA thioester hydrolase